MRIKYQRTSTDAQHGKRFETDTDDYDLVLFDRGISGTKPFKERTQARKVVELVESSQVKELIVEELRDIARDTKNCLDVIEFLSKHNVNVVIKSMGIQSITNGKPNPIFNLISSVISALYSMELENLKNRCDAGRIAYLNNGGKLGREKNSNETIKQFLSKPKTKEIISLLDKKKSVRDITGRLKVSSNLVLKVRKHHLVVDA